MANLKRVIALVIAALTVFAVAPAALASSHTTLDRAAAALGGADALQDLESFTVEASGTRWTLDEGPFAGSGASAPGPYSVTVSVDVVNDQQRLDTELVSYFFFARVLAEVASPDGGFVDGQDNNFAPPFAAAMLSDRWASTRLHQRLLHPQLLVLDALRDPSSVHMQRNALVFDTGGAPLKLNLDPATGLPVSASTVESDPLRRDLRLVVSYGDWTTVAGVAFPMSVSVVYGGETVQEEVRSSVAVNAPLDPALFEFPVGVTPVFDATLAQRGIVRHQMLQSFAALGFPRDGLQPFVAATELAPGVYHLTGGSHHSLAVVQDGGVVIVETPLDEVRTAAIEDWVDANLGLPITHAVLSHHHADHSAGLRQFVAGGAIPVVHDTARAFFRSVFRAPSRLVPDGLSGAPSTVLTVPSGGSSVLDDPVNPVGVHTIDSPHASDLVLVEAGGVLFVVDIFNPGLPAGPDAEPILPRVLELGLDVDFVAGGHGGVITWDEFVALFP